MSLTLHHLERSRSHRVLWLLEELGVDYQVERYSRNPATFRADPALRELHPLGKSPVLADGERVYAETGAIIEHLVEAHGEGRLRPAAGSEAADRYRYFLHYAEGSLMPPLLVRLIFDKVASAPVPFFVRPVVRGVVAKVEDNFTRGELKLQAAFLEGELASRPYFAGDDFSAADIQMSYPVEALVDRGRLPEGDTPRLRAFVDRIRARPAYQRAIEIGGPIF